MHQRFGDIQIHILFEQPVLVSADKGCICDQSFKVAIIAVVYQIGYFILKGWVGGHVYVFYADGEMLA